MDVEEVITRLFRRYMHVLIVMIIVPVTGASLYVITRPATYTAHARLVVALTMPKSPAEAAAAISQAQAVATSPDLVSKVLSQTGVTQDVTEATKSIVVSGLGSSAVADLAFSDPDPAVAQKVTNALANETAAMLDSIRTGLTDVIKVIDDELAKLADERTTTAAITPRTAAADLRLDGLDRLIADINASKSRITSSGTASIPGHSNVISAAGLPAEPDPRGLVPIAGLAAILGLALALIFAGINETFRPSVSGAFRVGRLLEVPILGKVSSDPIALANLGRRIRLAARRATVSTVVLVRANGGPLSPELVDRIEATTLRPGGVTARVGIPNINGERPAGAVRKGSKALATENEGLSIITMAEPSTKTNQVQQVCALDELDPSVEADQIGLVLLAGTSTRIRSIEQIRDLMVASGWPLLGVVGDGSLRGGRK